MLVARRPLRLSFAVALALMTACASTLPVEPRGSDAGEEPVGPSDAGSPVQGRVFAARKTVFAFDAMSLPVADPNGQRAAALQEYLAVDSAPNEVAVIEFWPGDVVWLTSQGGPAFVPTQSLAPSELETLLGDLLTVRVPWAGEPSDFLTPLDAVAETIASDAQFAFPDAGATLYDVVLVSGSGPGPSQVPDVLVTAGDLSPPTSSVDAARLSTVFIFEPTVALNCTADPSSCALVTTNAQVLAEMADAGHGQFRDCEEATTVTYQGL